MDRSFAYSQQTVRLRHKIASENVKLELFRLGRFTVSGRKNVQASLDLWQAQLRLREIFDLSIKFDPDQPRIPAGARNGGQWTNEGAAPTSNEYITSADAAHAVGLHINEAQQADLKSIVDRHQGNYVEAYRYLHRLVETRLMDPKLGAMDRAQLQAQEFWLRNAIDINGNDPTSQANFFIRGVTRNGLRYDDLPATPAIVQQNSNAVGEYVIGSVMNSQSIPPVKDIIAQDAVAATGRGKQTIGGWGGAFNYWDIPLTANPLDTVGTRILSDPAQYEKFISVNAKALADTVARFDRRPQYAAKALMQGIDAQVPTRIKQEIVLRAIDGIDGETGGFAGNPYDIDGYHPRFDDDENVVGWFSHDRDINEINVTNKKEIYNLNVRYRLRRDKNEFHYWQTAGSD